MIQSKLTKTETQTVVDDYDTIDKAAQIIYYFAGFINVLLLLRLIFKAFGANPGSGIVQLVYGLSQIFLIPFRGIFGVAAAGEFVVEPSILVAIVLYSLLAKGLVELLYILSSR